MEKRQPVRRRRYSSEQRQEFIALFRKSSLSQSQFAHQHGLKLCTFNRWLHRAPRPAKAPTPVFQEVFLPSPEVEIGVGSGITVKLGLQSSPEFIAQIVHHLRRSC